ncbi:MAG: hypothetical protein QOC94_3110 [Actinoplanes sp.]|nr:hypothetical protein [Actinoplanes sp.]
MVRVPPVIAVSRVRTDAFRVRAGAARRFAAGLLALVALAGCGDLEQAAAAGRTRNDLAGDLAAQMGGSASLTYTAAYQLAGGKTATISQAQNPARSAYAYPGGKIIVTPDTITRCNGSTCTVTPAATPASPAPTGTLTAPATSGMVLPATVLALLNAASLDTEKTVQQRDTTIAGHHASCAGLAGVNGAETSAFTVCITNEGLLGSFQATIAGTAIDAAMTRYSETADPKVFDTQRTRQ